MLDGLDAKLHRPADGLIRIEVGGDIGLRVARLFDRGADSSADKPRNAIGSVGDDTPPLAMILMNCAPALISSRAARRTSSTPSTTRPRAPACLGIVVDVAGMIAAAIIGVAAGLREGLAADDEARSFDKPFLDSHDEAVIGAAQVADGGEAAHQHVAHDLGRAERNQRVRQLVAAERCLRTDPSAEASREERFPGQPGAAIPGARPQAATTGDLVLSAEE